MPGMPRTAAVTPRITAVGIKAFHIFFVSVSTLLFLLLGVWRVSVFSDQGGAAILAQAVGSFVLVAAFLVYGRYFLKKLRGLGYMALPLAFALGLAAIPESAWACATCFGDPASPLTDGMNKAILALLAVITSVLASFAGLFLYWASRMRRNQRATDYMTASTLETV